MAKEVELPNGDIVEFPDDMENSAIEAVLKKHKAPAMESNAGYADMKLPGWSDAPDFSDVTGGVQTTAKMPVPSYVSKNATRMPASAPQLLLREGYKNPAVKPQGGGFADNPIMQALGVERNYTTSGFDPAMVPQPRPRTAREENNRANFGDDPNFLERLLIGYTNTMDDLGSGVVRGGFDASQVPQGLENKSILESAQKIIDARQHGGYWSGNMKAPVFIPVNDADVKKALADIAGVSSSSASAAVERQGVYEQYPPGIENVEDIDAAQGLIGKGKAMLMNPIDTFTNKIVPSTVASAPVIVAAALSRNPMLLSALGGGSIAYSQEAASGVTDYLSQNGVDVSDEAAVQAALSDPAVLSAALEYTNESAAIVGGASLLSGGLAGKSMAPSFIKGAIPRAASDITQQALAGGVIDASGEAVKQVNARGEITDPESVLLEAFSGGIESPVSAASRIKNEFDISKDVSNADTAELKRRFHGAKNTDEKLAAALALSQRGESITNADLDAKGVAPVMAPEAVAGDQPEAKPAIPAKTAPIAPESTQTPAATIVPAQPGSVEPAAPVTKAAPIEPVTPQEPISGQTTEGQTTRPGQEKTEARQAEGTLPGTGVAPKIEEPAVTKTPAESLAEYGYTLDGTQLVSPKGKALSAFVSPPKNGRIQVRDANKKLLWSGPPENAGDFVKDYWYAKKIETPAEPQKPITPAGLPEDVTSKTTQVSLALDRALTKKLGSPLEGRSEIVTLPDDADGTRTKELQSAIRDTFGMDTQIVRFGDDRVRYGYNGFTNIKGAPKVAVVSEDSANPFATVAGHELVHYVRKYHPDLYGELRTMLRDAGADVKKFRGEVLDPSSDANNETRLSDDVAEEELYADTHQELFTDKEYLKKLQAKNPNAFERFAKAAIEWVDKILARMKSKPNVSQKYYRDMEAVRDAFVDVMSRVPNAPAKTAVKETGIIASDTSPASSSKTPDDKTNTPEFKKWFGESKVVDKDGSPVVVYHGTNKKFKKFDPKKSVAGQFWFTSDKSKADNGYDGAEGKGVTMDVYLSIKNPASWDEYDKYSVGELVGKGYDGLVLPDDGETVYVVFDNKQIKSASRNSGAFDPDNASIVSSRKKPEKEKSLIVTHNLTAENLLHADRVGGLAVPSLAITKSGDAVVSFGEITLIGNEWLADPKRGAKAYGADVYSPRYPSISYKLDKYALKALNASLAEYRTGREMYGSEIDNLEDLTQRDEFKAYMAAKFGDDYKWSDLKREAASLLRKSGAEERIFKGYTNNGRSYTPHTLENVVKILKKDMVGGESFNYGVGSLRAKFTPKFKSIADIKKNEGRLVTPENFAAIKKEIDDEFFSIVEELRPRAGSGVSFGFADKVINVMEDAPKVGIAKALEEYDLDGLDDTDIIESISDFLNKLKTLPTEYFEVLHARAVGLNEFDVAVVPDDTDEKAINALKRHGLDVEKYQSGNDSDRKAVVKSVSEQRDIVFSRMSPEDRAAAMARRAPKPEPKITSTKNAVMEEERANEGRDPIVKAAEVSNEETLDIARDRIRRNPSEADEIVFRLNNTGLASVSSVDEAVLLLEKVRLRNARDEAADRASDEKGTDESRALAKQKWYELELKINDIDQATNAAGSEWGRMGQFRQRALRDDYTFAAMERKQRVLEGRALTLNESAKIKAMAEQIEQMQIAADKARRDLDDANMRAQSAATYDQLVKSMSAALRGERKTRPLIETLKAGADESMKELRKMLTRASAGVDPVAFFHLTRIGAYHIANGAVKFSDWASRMKTSLGDLYDSVREGLRDVFEASKVQAKEPVEKKTNKKTRREIVAEGVTHKDVYDLAMKYVQAGMRGEDNVMKAVHDELAKVVEGITERDVRRLFSEYGKANFPSKDEDKKALREIRALVQMQESIDRLQEGLDALKSGAQRDKQTQLMRDKRKQLNALLKKQEKNSVASEEKLATYMNARANNLRNQIEDLETQIATGQRPQKVPAPVPNMEVLKLIAERDALRQQLNEIDGKLPSTPEERYQKSRATSLRNQLEKVRARIAANDYERVARPAPKQLDAKNTQAAFELAKAKEEFARFQFKSEMAKRSPLKKIFSTVPESLNLARALMTSLDFSAVARQGGLITMGHPARAAKSVWPMLKAFKSEKYANDVMEKIKKRDNYALYQKAKLDLTETDGYTLSKMEEAFMSRWLEYVPTAIGGGLLRGSQRAYVTFLNKLRADSFDAMAASLALRAEPTLDEAKAIANFINIATGRGKIGTGNNQGWTGLNTVFFAPRLVASRFNYLAGQPLYGGSAQTRKLIAQEYARTLTGIGVVMGLGYAAFLATKGDDDEDDFWNFDPRSSDFLKMKFGNTRIDPLSGLAQVTTFLARVITGEKVDDDGNAVPLRNDYRPLEYYRDPLNRKGVKFGGDNTFDTITRFGRTKLAPVVGAAINLVTGSDVMGDAVTPASAATGLITPLSLQNVKDVMQEHGVAGGSAITALELLGMGVQHYGSTQSADRAEYKNEYDKIVGDVDDVVDQVENRISALPSDQWEDELDKLKKQYPVILRGVEIEKYADTTANENKGRAGDPKKTKEGGVKLVLGNDKTGEGTVLGELEGYRYYDPFKKRDATTDGIKDNITQINRSIKRIKDDKALTTEKLVQYVATAPIELQSTIAISDKIRAGADSLAKRKASRDDKTKVLDELSAALATEKRKAIDLVKRGERGEKIKRSSPGE